MASERPEEESSHILIILHPFKTYHNTTPGKCKVMSSHRVDTQLTGVIKDSAKYLASGANC